MPRALRRRSHRFSSPFAGGPGNLAQPTTFLLRPVSHPFHEREDCPLFSSAVPIEQLALRLGLALLFGGIIGIEREWRSKPAGLRTHMMVSLAAATFTLVTLEFFGTLKRADGDAVSTDPLRLVEAITAGVAFLGAGAIIQSRGHVQGITTGSGIWLAGAIGFACGGGFYVLAAVATACAVVILSLLGWLTVRIKGEDDPDDPPAPKGTDKAGTENA